MCNTFVVEAALLYTKRWFLLKLCILQDVAHYFQKPDYRS